MPLVTTSVAYQPCRTLTFLCWLYYLLLIVGNTNIPCVKLNSFHVIPLQLATYTIIPIAVAAAYSSFPVHGQDTGINKLVGTLTHWIDMAWIQVKASLWNDNGFQQLLLMPCKMEVTKPIVGETTLFYVLLFYQAAPIRNRVANGINWCVEVRHI